ncbi:ATP-binding protein, partial [Streptomyces muensis]|nr:ATP-binding protein [Streptomyces muensis]
MAVTSSELFSARPAGEACPGRPQVTELRLSAFAGHRRAELPVGPLTFFAGPSASYARNAVVLPDPLGPAGRGCRG